MKQLNRPMRRQTLENDVVDQPQLEKITNTLIEIYDIQGPPVPIESMLQRPLDEMWEELDISKLSSSFINVSDFYAPRMSLARLLARHIAGSDWGKERGLDAVGRDEEKVRAFARMLMMPSSLVTVLSASARTPEWLSIHFEVPADDALMRLQELGLFKR